MIALSAATRNMATLIIATPWFVCACAVRRPYASYEQEVIAAQRELITANNAADTAVVDRLTADEWIGVEAAGVSRTKADFRAWMVARGAAAVQATGAQLAQRQKEWRVQVYGNVGIITRLTAGDHGGRSWITTVWVRREGRWQRVLSQGTAALQP